MSLSAGTHLGSYEILAPIGLLSPDGDVLAFDREEPADVYVLDLARRGQASRFTTDPGVDAVPVWSPDGRSLTFLSSRNPAGNVGPNNPSGGSLWVRPYGAVGEEVEVHRTNAGKVPTDWSRHGYMVYVEDGDIWTLPRPAAEGSQPLQVTKTSSVETNAQLSPDGRWIAYNALELGGQNEVFIQAFPAQGARQQVSTRGGWRPRWSADGSELFFFELETEPTLMSVSVKSAGSELEVSPPVRLFSARLPAFSGFRTFEGSSGARSYDVAADGRFLINIATSEQAAPLLVIHNWTATLRK